jgi:hypothetical protein
MEVDSRTVYCDGNGMLSATSERAWLEFGCWDPVCAARLRVNLSDLLAAVTAKPKKPKGKKAKVKG